MKRIIFVITMLLMMQFVIADEPTAAVLKTSDAQFLSQDPDPAEPGGNVELRFKIENVGREDLDEFIFVDVAPGSVTTRSIADGPQQRYMFIIQIDIYVPINTGTAIANGYADALITLLLAKTIGDVLIRRVGNVYRQNADSHFRTTILFHAQMDA